MKILSEKGRVCVRQNLVISLYYIFFPARICLNTSFEVYINYDSHEIVFYIFFLLISANTVIIFSLYFLVRCGKNALSLARIETSTDMTASRV